jgi:GT2 family glycosyltransferase
MDGTERSGLAVGITTRNRPQALLRCLTSLTLLGDLLTEVIVVDDTSDPPVDEVVGRAPRSVTERLTVIRQDASEGNIVARNTLMRRATTEFVLLLDDDACLLDGHSVRKALAAVEGCPDVAAVAFAQAEADGRRWPAAMQPALATYPCRIAAFIGFAHLLRRSAFHDVGGYREELHFYGEEKDLCARLLMAGAHVVYLPDALVAHLPDPSGRSHSKYVRHVIRNDCLFDLYYEPLPVSMASIPVRLWRYFAMRRGQSTRDLPGFLWVLGQLGRAAPRVLKTRQPMSWSQFAEWRRLRGDVPPWPA